uniref:Uncharacterized protein n=1 Tax=Pristionchus pacificus TaxID=54126 RepID=A0A2A6C9L2_PRIPA|eukprot:PDM74711.1 hypothetical protein PRIPAC_43662 [Pristionchus pacificus]
MGGAAPYPPPPPPYPPPPPIEYPPRIGTTLEEHSGLFSANVSYVTVPPPPPPPAYPPKIQGYRVPPPIMG